MFCELDAITGFEKEEKQKQNRKKPYRFHIVVPVLGRHQRYRIEQMRRPVGSAQHSGHEHHDVDHSVLHRH